jgi:YD repeat-containing protein
VYDDLNRLRWRTFDGTGVTIAYRYDDAGNRLEMTDGTGTTTYGYDALYRLTNVTYPDESTEAYEYDEVGNRLRKWVNGALAEQYGYNEANQLVRFVLPFERSNDIMSGFMWSIMGISRNRLRSPPRW